MGYIIFILINIIKLFKKLLMFYFAMPNLNYLPFVNAQLKMSHGENRSTVIRLGKLDSDFSFCWGQRGNSTLC